MLWLGFLWCSVAIIVLGYWLLSLLVFFFGFLTLLVQLVATIFVVFLYEYIDSANVSTLGEFTENNVEVYHNNSTSLDLEFFCFITLLMLEY